MSRMIGSSSSIGFLISTPLTCACSPIAARTLIVTAGFGSGSFSLGIRDCAVKKKIKFHSRWHKQLSFGIFQRDFDGSYRYFGGTFRGHTYIIRWDFYRTDKIFLLDYYRTDRYFGETFIALVSVLVSVNYFELNRDKLYVSVKDRISISNLEVTKRIFSQVALPGFLGFFLAFDFCRFCVVIRFFHPRHNGQWPPTLKDFLSQILSITFIFQS